MTGIGGPAIVAFGGGHGLAASLAALRRLTSRLTAVVTVADDGGSSGRLRQELGCLPPGDLRMALAALCCDDADGIAWAETLQGRFAGTGPLAGHAVGNLLIAGIWQQCQDPVAGLDRLGHLIGIQGRVLPMSTVPLEIEADVIGLDPLTPDDVLTLNGQATIAKTRATVEAVRIIPDRPPAASAAVAAVREADVLVLGPGSWFTSVIPHLLVPDLAEAILGTAARRILVLNLEPAAETAGFSAARHLEILAEHAPLLRLDYVVAPREFGSHDRHLRNYAESLGACLVVADVALEDGSPRHDPARLAAALGPLVDR
ncbi:MAG: uridine diphosphate-N-acetylglucosamine-binding protein YvcK [Arachnia sp.]